MGTVAEKRPETYLEVYLHMYHVRKKKTEVLLGRIFLTLRLRAFKDNLQENLIYRS